MAEVASNGEVLSLTAQTLPASAGLSEVFSGNIFPVLVASRAGWAAPLMANALVAGVGVHAIIPGVRQGVLAAMTGGAVDFTEWVWKLRYPPWCGFDPPLVRRLSMWLTPKSNDPTGHDVRLSIAWGDGLVTDGCRSGESVRHDYATMGRYTVRVQAVNALGDGMTVERDVVVVAYPDGEDAWRWGQSPGALMAETDLEDTV